MLLGRENKNSTGNLLKTLANPLKTPTYVPPIRGFDKPMKPFYSPNEGSHPKAFNFQTPPSPRRDSFKVLQPKQSLAKVGVSEEKETEREKPKMMPEKPRTLGINLNSLGNIRGPQLGSLSSARDYLPIQKDLNSKESIIQRNGSKQDLGAPNQEPETENPAPDPTTTYEIFTSRLNKLQTKAMLPNYEVTRYSERIHGVVKGFAVCTNQGLVRNYNEDRVSIVLNILKPSNKDLNDYWPNCSIFGVFDGHGGAKCAEFLRNHLHHFIVKNKNFPWNPTEALKEAFEEADHIFLEEAVIPDASGKHDRSGSCALVCMIMDDTIYLSNLGDSRGILSQSGGMQKIALTRDHKPSDKQEQKRITEAGGKIYQNFPLGANGKRLDIDPKMNPFNIQIPHRILPGRLSVSRSFGDAEAKLARFGGNPHVLISKPEITTLKVQRDQDFIVLGSDGIFDKLSNEEVIDSVWNTIKSRPTNSQHEILKFAAEAIIKDAMLKKSLDNVTAIIISFANLLEPRSIIGDSDMRPTSKKEFKLKSDNYESNNSNLNVNAGKIYYNLTPTTGGTNASNSNSTDGLGSQRIRTPTSKVNIYSTNQNGLQYFKDKLEEPSRTDSNKRSIPNLPKLGYGRNFKGDNN